MMPAIAVLDIALLAVFIFALVVDWRQGAVPSTIAILDVVLDLVISMPLAPLAMAQVENQSGKILLGLGTVILFTLIGRAVGTMVGQSLRNTIRSPLTVGLDSSLGVIMQLVTALVVTWMIAVPPATTVPGQFAGWVRESRGMNLVDQVAPGRWSDDSSGILRQLRDGGMPAIAPPFGYKQNVPDKSADPSVISQDIVDNIRPSIIRVLEEAPQYERLLQDAGFVIASGLILTNAHVVAGVAAVRLGTVVDMADANIMHYGPLDDVALLRITDLPLELIQWAGQEVRLGDGAVVLGFSESEPSKTTPACVTKNIIIRGPDIYSSTRHERQSYVLRADVRHGNSGDLLITPRRQILGLIFDAGMNSDWTGYALTHAGVQPHIDEATDDYGAISTQECMAG